MKNTDIKTVTLEYYTDEGLVRYSKEMLEEHIAALIVCMDDLADEE